MCDHIIGLDHEYDGEHILYVSDIGTHKIIKEMLDRRMGCMTHFNYFPMCGEEIKWSELRKKNLLTNKK